MSYSGLQVAKENLEKGEKRKERKKKHSKARRLER
jgi:hypothetical protein